MNERLTTSPGEQVNDAGSIGAASATIRSVDADNHAGQDGPEHSHSPILPYSTSPEAIDTLATSSIGGRREESTSVTSTRQSLQPCKSVCTSRASLL
jgi:hypothetical protein